MTFICYLSTQNDKHQPFHNVYTTPLVHLRHTLRSPTACLGDNRRRIQCKKLDDFEGEAYKITHVEVVMEDGTKVEGDMYVWDGDMEKLSDEPWDLEWFVKERLEDWLDLFEGMELVGDGD